MTTLETIPDRDLMARINVRQSALRSFERSDGNQWHDERYQRESCRAEIEALAAEWRRRQGRGM